MATITINRLGLSADETSALERFAGSRGPGRKEAEAILMYSRGHKASVIARQIREPTTFVYNAIYRFKSSGRLAAKPFHLNLPICQAAIPPDEPIYQTVVAYANPTR